MNIGFLGLGKLGLPVSLAVEDKGHKIFGYDISKQTIDDIRNRKIRYREEWVDKYLPNTKLEINSIDQLVKNSEKKKIYQNLLSKNIKEIISINIQKFLNFFAKDNCTLIFSTYMSNSQEFKLNLLVNKSILYYKSLRPYLLFKNSFLFSLKRKNPNKYKLMMFTLPQKKN